MNLNLIKYLIQIFEDQIKLQNPSTHAPGQSSFNPMERGMAPLSSKLARIVLPIDHYGTHLNSQGKVINEELAKKNFRFSGIV